MGNLGCNKGECFYNSSGKCTNIAVSITTDCGLFFDVNNKKEWKPKRISKPSMDGQTYAKIAKLISAEG